MSERKQMNDKQKVDLVLAIIAQGDQVKAAQRHLLRDMPEDVLLAMWRLAKDACDRESTEAINFAMSLGCVVMEDELARRMAVAVGVETEDGE